MPDNNNSAVNSEVNDLFTGKSTQSGRTDTQILESIERQIELLVKNGGKPDISASNAINRYGRNGSTHYQDMNRNSRIRGTYRDFGDAFKKSITEELFGSDFKNAMNDIRTQLAKDLGVELGEIPKSLGDLTGKLLSKTIKESSLGKAILDPINKYKQDLAKQMKDAYARGRGNVIDSMYERFNASSANASQSSADAKVFRQSTDALDKVSKAVSSKSKSMNMMGDISDVVGADKLEAAHEFAGVTSQAGSMKVALGGLTEVVSTVGPKVLAASAATMGLSVAVDLVTDYFKDALKPALEDFKKMLAEVSKSTKRSETERQQKLDASRKRLEDDIRTMAEAPFNILRDAAEKWYSTWDSTLRSISATQGYTKDQVYQLYGTYVDRLRSEGLTDVIGSTDIINNLSNVLAAGLQGAAAEEFAYIATKLNAAIPTQDFFNYTEGYITAVSNAMNQGKTQAEAIAMANAELETFANSLLYAGREISGGFTVGLKGAEALFQKAEQIAQAGRFGTGGTQLGSTLTAISAITGAIAPDLASGIVDAVYKAAVGGNASDIVALRSLAGINASNTEFLQAIVNNPQQVFGDMFTKLSQLQNMSNGAYMEVAEGLSSVFGVSMDSFARIDFNQLASAVKASANPNSALNQNMKLLSSGQTTTNAEILRMRQINQYIAEDGLGYVLDNEAARAVLQHEWDEQIAKELMETTYGVELTGSALQFLNTVSNTVNRIANFMNPFSAVKKVEELSVTVKQESALKDDIKQALELGKVGAGNASVLSQLTSYNLKTPITDTYVELLGGSSAFRDTQAEISKIRNKWGGIGYSQNDVLNGIGRIVDRNNSLNSAISGGRWLNALGSMYSTGSDVVSGALLGQFSNIFRGNDKSVEALGVSSAKSMFDDIFEISSAPYRSMSSYQWGRIGKSSLVHSGMYGLPNYDYGASVVSASAVASASQTQSRLNDNLQKMLTSMDDYYSEDNTRSYEDFVATAKQYGIADYKKALEQGGLTEEDVRNRYNQLQDQTAISKQQDRNRQEEQFWEDNILQLTTSNTWLESINSTATDVFNLFDDFVSAWKDYFIEHTVYNSAFDRSAVEKVLNAERDSSETAIYALADALTQNDVGLLLDPTVQTNALLSQILKVANAILVQSSNGGGAISLPDTIAGLSLGIISQE